MTTKVQTFGMAMAAAMALAACSGTHSEENDKLIETSKALADKLGEPGEKAQMPTADDPAVRAYDAEAQKAMTQLGTDAMPVAGIDSYDELCAPSAKIIGAYINAGVPQGGDSAANTAKMTENASRYLGQMLTPLLFTVHCSAVHMPVIDKEIADQDMSDKAAAMTQVRNGAFGQVTGLLQMALSSDIEPGQRDRVIDLLSRDIGKLAVAFTHGQREQLSGMLAQASEAAPPALKPKLEAMKQSVAAAPCGKICSA